MAPHLAASLMALGAVLAEAATGGAGDDGPVLERGAFRLHHYKRPTGRETYEIAREGDRLVLRSSVEYAGGGRKLPRVASRRVRDDLSPERVEVKGTTSRFTAIDAVASVEGRTATVSDVGEVRRVEVPDRSFFL